MRTCAVLVSLVLLVILVPATVPAAQADAVTVAGDETAYLPVAEVMPEPVGGLPAICKRLVYPDDARRANIEGKVYIVAYINESGDVDDVKVLRGLQSACDQAAVKAVKETKFTAGKMNGATVKCQLSIPITFRLTK